MSYRLDHRELSRIAREDFGVEYPIKVQRRKRRIDPRNGLPSVSYGMGGRHVWWWSPGNRVPGHHDIVVVTGSVAFDYPLQMVLNTLAHELRHAWQAELFGNPDDWSHAYLSERRDAAKALGVSRWTNSNSVRLAEYHAFEVDANEAADDMWPLLTSAVHLTKGA